MPEAQPLLAALDVLVDGPFLLSQRSLELPWRGSRNQRILDVPQALPPGPLSCGMPLPTLIFEVKL